MDILTQIVNFVRTLFQWWAIVTPWEQGIRVRLGKYIDRLEPGIHLKFPIIDKVHIQPIRLRVISISDQCLMTADKKVIVLAGSIAYRIIDLLKLYETLHNPTEAIEQKVMGIISKCAFEVSLDELSPEILTKSVNQEIDLKEYGLENVGFFLTSFAAVRTYRVIGGELGKYNDYADLLRTD